MPISEKRNGQYKYTRRDKERIAELNHKACAARERARREDAERPVEEIMSRGRVQFNMEKFWIRAAAIFKAGSERRMLEGRNDALQAFHRQIVLARTPEKKGRIK